MHPYVARGSSNNGIRGYVDLDTKYLNEANSISFGQDTATVYYQKNAYFTGDKIKIMVLKQEELDELTACYLIAAIRKSFMFFSWGNTSFSEKVINSTKIYLPVDKFSQPDYNYMRARVRELEQERKRELETYLKAAGFEDCTLSESETKILNLIEKNIIHLKEVKIGSLFDIHPTKTYGLTNKYLFREKGDTPVVSNTSLNNGITDKIGLEPTEKGNMITYSDTTTSNAIFYQPFSYVGYSHVQGLYPFKPQGWTENTLLYFVTLFRKSAAGRFDYANKFNRTIASNLSVSIPVTDDGSIDFNVMETYIRAIKKAYIARLKTVMNHEQKVYNEVANDSNK